MTEPSSAADAVTAQRCAAQLLSGAPARSPVEVVHRLLAVQGQDPRGARLSIRARSTGLAAADVDRALTDDRALLITWLNRGTLHLIRSDDYWWLHPLTAPRMRTGIARRLAQEGVLPGQAETAAAVIASSLADEGPLTRHELGERIARAGIRTEGQALVHLLAHASVAGIAVRGPMVRRRPGAAPEHAFVGVRDWLGQAPAATTTPDRDAALAELARRYLAGHGPASEGDLAQWSGLPLRDARRGLSAIAASLRERDDNLAELAEQASDRAGELPPPRLLGPFDPVLHGWVSREPILGQHKSIITVNGLFRPFAMVDAHAAGTWKIAAGQVELDLFAPLPESAAAALRADGADVVRYLGLDATASASS
jgi:hypothetical protein